MFTGTDAEATAGPFVPTAAAIAELEIVVDMGAAREGSELVPTVALGGVSVTAPVAEGCDAKV